MKPLLLCVLMVIGIALTTIAAVIVWKRRAHLKQSAQLVEPVAQAGDAGTPLYRLDVATGLYQPVQVLPVQGPVMLVSAKWRKKIAMALAMVLVFFAPLAVMQPANAALSEAMRGIFSGALADFVNGVMNDTSGDIYTYTWMMFLTFSVIGIVIEVAKFIWGGYQMESHLTFILWWFACFGIMGGYNAFTEAVWGIGVGLSNAYQQYLVGNTDNFFLAQWIHKSMAAVVLEDLSFFDTVRLMGYYWIWMVAGTLLDLVAYLAAMWADFGYALSKVIGIIFVPFLLLPATRPLFDGWFKFFTGFVVLLIVIKATMVVAAITVKAILESLGVSFSGGGYGSVGEVVQIAKENMYLVGDAAVMLIIAILFVLSSFVFAGTLASGVGSLSGGLGTAANLAIRKFLK
ncbi:hypothetical protein LZ023_40780 (plasmid) [Pseudomonas silvicola]|nr:hypothetical protein LZ023_41055 [Pseudomonas silvicola]WAH62271.1 hypothetical protein LZ023_40780 [Pseudomonas silvicola]